MRNLVLAASVAVTVAGACGSGSGGSGQAASCRSACSRCGGDLCVDCSATSARLRDEFETGLYACVLAGSDAACDTLWSGCAAQAATGLSARAIDTTYRDACMAKRNQCASAGVNFADDYCLQSALLTESYVASAQQCLTQACDAIQACLGPLFG
jgi:hypothetical protein